MTCCDLTTVFRECQLPVGVFSSDASSIKCADQVTFSPYLLRSKLLSSVKNTSPREHKSLNVCFVDLCGRMLVFPEETSTAHVVLNSSEQTFSALTVCLRFITDLKREHSIFSLSTSSAFNAFLIFKPSASGVISIYVNNKEVKFEGMDYKVNEWHSLCSTWDSKSGVVQLWLDGKPSIMKYIGGVTITNPSSIVGQEQDFLGGGFSKSQSFVGMMCEINMWNYVLSACEIERYMTDQDYALGNLINWRNLGYKIEGRVLIEDKQKSCPRHYW